MFQRNLVIFSLIVLIVFNFSLANTKIRYGIHPDKLRIVIDSKRKIYKYKVFTLKNPYRIVVDIFRKDIYIKRVRLPEEFKYRIGNHPWGKRIVIIPKRKYSFKYFSLQGRKIVIDFKKVNEKKFAKKVNKKYIVPFEKKVIVIDPGHGGKDPGAIGYKGLKEKWVNLRIAYYLAYYLKKDGRFKVILTRKGDYYVPLEERVKIAVKNNADLFISIHSDAAPKGKRYARGTQIFALSYTGAYKKKKELVRNVYFAQLLFGKAAKIPRSRIILSDLAFYLTLNESERFAKILAKKLKTNLRRNVYFKGIKRANFVVLKTPGIPSVLIETAFITNPYEAKKLRNPTFQRKFAYSIYKAIVEYFYPKKAKAR